MAIPAVTDLLSSVFKNQVWVQTDKINTDENGVPLGDFAEVVSVSRPSAEVGNGFCAALQQLSDFVQGLQAITALSVATSLGIPTYTTAGRPAAGTAGRVIFDTDLSVMLVDDGTQFLVVGGSGSATVLLDIDVTSFPTTDLNTAGNTVTDNAGLVWTTATAANDGQNMVTAINSFGTVNGTGLSVDGPQNARMEGGATRTTTGIYAGINDIATAYGVELDVRGRLGFEVYVDSNNADADHEYSGVAISRPPNAVTASPTLFGDGATYVAAVGHTNGNSNSGFGSGGTGAGPTKFSRPGITGPPDTACLVHENSAIKAPMIGVMGGSGATFPLGHEWRATASIRDVTDAENDIVLDAFQGFRVWMFHCAENLSNNYIANIARFRILKL